MSSRIESYHFRKPKIQNRVVVTGVGSVTPLGLSAAESWQNAIRGNSGIAPITRFDTTEFEVKFGGEVKNFNPDLYVQKKDQRRMDRFIHFALAASQMAIEDSGLKFNEDLKRRTGVIVGAGMGGLPETEVQYLKLVQKGPRRVNAFFVPMTVANLAAGQVSIYHGLKGVNYSISSACASGAHSIGEAMKYIRDGVCDVMLAGGTESTICPLALAGFTSMRALSMRNESPTQACRPFDQKRDGFVLSEGSAILVLESLAHAEKRGAKILCEVVGYGASSDAFHITIPSPEGVGGALAIQLALQDAGLRPEQIDYVNAHGTSTPIGDTLETQGLKIVFQEHVKKLWISSTKSMTGHALGAAGAIESAFCVQTIRDQIAPPTINLEKPGEGCDLDYIPGEARQGKINYAMNSSFGFGGTNAVLIFSKLI